jgi:hypothetical protein
MYHYYDNSCDFTGHDGCLIDFKRRVNYSRPIAFIRDCYSVHRSAQIKQVAALGIELHLVPLGATGFPQPLNRPVFPVLKLSAWKAFHDQCMKDPGMRCITRDAVEDLVHAWDSMPDSRIEVAWKYIMRMMKLQRVNSH